MAEKNSTKKARLRVQLKFDVPLEEVSGICLRRDRDRQMSLVAVGDRVAKVAWASLPKRDDWSIEWYTADISRLSGSALPTHDAQLEAVCADGAGRILLLQESPPRAELVDLQASRVVATILLDIKGSSRLAEAWSDPQGSRGEGAVLLPGGRLLVAKEKHPAALIEFGPDGANSQGLVRGGALADGEPWPIEPGDHRFVALAVWRPDKALAKTCEDFSDLEIGPDGRLYALSDKSAAIARLDDLPAGGGDAASTASWRLEDLGAKPEGLAFAATGRAVVALDKRKARNNLVVLEPAVAIADSQTDDH